MQVLSKFSVEIVIFRDSVNDITKYESYLTGKTFKTRRGSGISYRLIGFVDVDLGW